MKTMKRRQFTTPLQAQSLLRIGLCADSCDCFRANTCGGNAVRDNFFLPHEGDYGDDDTIFVLYGGETFSERMAAIRADFPPMSGNGYAPCWSMGELLRLYLFVSGLTDEHTGLHHSYGSFLDCDIETLVGDILNDARLGVDFTMIPNDWRK